MNPKALPAFVDADSAAVREIVCKRNKNDAADAEAICEAMARPNARNVPIKTVEQQAVLSLHRARQGFIKARTAQANQIRGLLAEFGLTIPQGISHLRTRTAEILEDAGNDLFIPGQVVVPIFLVPEKRQ